MRSLLALALSTTLATTLATALAGCGSDTDPDLGGNETASELATATTSGAVSNSFGGSNMAMNRAKSRSILASTFASLLPDALAAATQCPTATNGATGCAASGSTMTLTYAGCSFQPANANSFTWSGSQTLTLSSGTASCGTFPAPSSGNSLTRAFSNPTTRTSPDGKHVITIDTSSTSSGWQTPLAMSGTKVTNGGSSHTLAMAVHISATRSGTSKKGNTVTKTVWDHTIDTPQAGGLTITSSGTQRTVNGQVRLQHNLAKYTATTTLTNVVYDTGTTCCHPQSGSVTTTYSGSKTGTETLTFSGTSCGAATLVDTANSSTPLTLTHCF